MRIHNMLCIAITVALSALFVTACGSPPVVQRVIEKTIYVCADKLQVDDPNLCPPGPVEEKIVYVCIDGSEVADQEECPWRTHTCPEGTTAYRNTQRGEIECVYNATCNEGWLYVPETGTCKKFCPIGQTLTEDGLTCVAVPDSNPRDCPEGQYLDAETECKAIPPTYGVVCPVGMYPYVHPENKETGCMYNSPCSEGQLFNQGTGECQNANPRDCPVGQYLDGNGVCQPISSVGSDLAVKTAGDNPTSMIVLGGSQNVTVAKFRFTGTDPHRVTALTLANCLEWWQGGGNVCLRRGVDEAIMAVKIRYTRDGGTVNMTGFFQNGLVTFNGIELEKAANISADLTVLVDTAAWPSNPAASGAEFRINVIGVEATNINTNTSHAFTTLASANKMVLRLTKPTISLASGSPSGAAIPGFSEVLRFNVTADAHGYVTVRQLLFKISSTDNDGEGTTGGDWNEGNLAQEHKWQLYDATDFSTPIGYGTQNAWLKSDGTPAGATDDVEYFRPYFDEPVEIWAGGTRTFVLKIDTTGASAANDDAIRIDIPDEREADSVGLDALRWDDEGVASNIDGALVKNLPVIGGTLVF